MWWHGSQGCLRCAQYLRSTLLVCALDGTGFTRKAPQGATKDMSRVGWVLKTSMASSLHLREYYLLRTDDTLGPYLQSKPDKQSLLKLWKEAKKRGRRQASGSPAGENRDAPTTLCPWLSLPILVGTYMPQQVQTRPMESHGSSCCVGAEHRRGLPQLRSDGKRLELFELSSPPHPVTVWQTETGEGQATQCRR